jgi:hypothetical protein
VIPVPVRVAIVVVGFVLLAGSWLVGNTVDAGIVVGPPRPNMLGKDAATFSARIIGAFLIVLGLLTWVFAQTIEHHTPIF